MVKTLNFINDYRINTEHPCYSEKAHHHYYRLHLPVAKKCNLGCNYCEREVGGPNYHSYRPAITRKILTPIQALQRAAQAFKESDLKVIGIAGPGEPLFNNETYQTLALVRKEFPTLIICVSTNGILIADNIQKLLEVGVQSVSITINSFNPETLEKLYQYVYTEKGGYLFSREAVCYIRQKQMDAIKTLVKNKITFKVNTILIPGINDGEMLLFTKQLKDLGVSLQNIVSFIPLGNLKNYPATNCQQLQSVREDCARYVPQFRFCKQCPADAFDIPGKRAQGDCL